ncbi:hypothetical protein TIFTF001_028726 [Ficus carica]|uniref:Uncharacterized protein n=1 Tax=Ficus carica TaxID=3494 RepID=A0AA88DQK6_FICCA|nr:hypothetical protein TIFTF001_028726 [Ficus carica]
MVKEISSPPCSQDLPANGEGRELVYAWVELVSAAPEGEVTRLEVLAGDLEGQDSSVWERAVAVVGERNQT